MRSALLSGASASVGCWLLLKRLPSRVKMRSSPPRTSATRAIVGTSRRQSDDHSSEIMRIFAGPPGWLASQRSAATCGSDRRVAS